VLVCVLGGLERKRGAQTKKYSVACWFQLQILVSNKYIVKIEVALSSLAYVLTRLRKPNTIEYYDALTSLSCLYAPFGETKIG
jgi:hypothetical protein